MKFTLPGLLLLLAAAPQDLMKETLTSETDLCSIRMPSGWSRVQTRRPDIFRYANRTEENIAPMISLRHVVSKTPGPPSAWLKALKDSFEKDYEDVKVIEEKEFKFGERDAGRIKVRVKTKHGAAILDKTIVFRNLRDVYTVDASYAADKDEKLTGLVQKVVATLKLTVPTITAEERADDLRHRALLKGRKELPKWIESEEWQEVFAGKMKLGHRMRRVGKNGDLYTFETRVHQKGNDGSRSDETTHGTFTADGSRQSVDHEVVIIDSKKKKMVRRVKITIEDGKVRAERSVDDYKQVREFKVPDGTVLEEVSRILVAQLAVEGKDSYLIRTLPVWTDESSYLHIDILGKERVKLDEEEREIVIVQAKSRQGEVITYWYGPDGHLVRQVSGRNVRWFRESTKEKATDGK